MLVGISRRIPQDLAYLLQGVAPPSLAAVVSDIRNLLPLQSAWRIAAHLQFDPNVPAVDDEVVVERSL